MWFFGCTKLTTIVKQNTSISVHTNGKNDTNDGQEIQSSFTGNTFKFISFKLISAIAIAIFGLLITIVNFIVYNRHSIIQPKHKTRMISTKLNCYVTYLYWWLLFQDSFKLVAATTDVLKIPKDTSKKFPFSETHVIATHGNFTIIGSPNDGGNLLLTNSGSAYIFDQNWDQYTKLTANDAASNDYFGNSVAIFDNIAVVGSPYHDEGGSNSGSVYIFQYSTNSGIWNQTAKLTPTNGSAYEYFGSAVAISISNHNNSNHYNYDHLIVVGTYWNNKSYVFTYNSSNGRWNEHTILRMDLQYYSFRAMCRPVAVTCNEYGTFVLVGSPDDDDLGSFSGSVYVYKYDDSNDLWNKFEKLTSSDGGLYDYFGTSIALYNDTAIIGASRTDSNDVNDAGGVYIFRYNLTHGSWIERGKLTASDTSSYADFGSVVDVFHDWIIVGAPHHIPYDVVPAAYVFRCDQTSSTWHEIAKIVTIDGASDTDFGGAVAINENSGMIMIGCSSNCDYPIYFENIENLQNPPPITLTVNYNYKTSVDIISIDSNTEYFLQTVDECNTIEQFNDTISWQLPIMGCYSIEFYDCDDSVVNDRTDNHGSYEIEVHGVLAGIGGYYLDSETQVVCAQNVYNHVSFCITPQFCVNNQHLWTHDEEMVRMSSYKAMINSTITYTLNTSDEIYIGCMGDQSCYMYGSILEVCYV